MSVLPLLLALSGLQTPDQCLAFVSYNLARGNANFYTYYRFSDRRLTVRKGDRLSYRVFLDPKNPVAKGGVDVEFADGGQALRDLPSFDQDGRRAHGDGDLSAAKGKWLQRTIPLDSAEGREAFSWNVNFEGDAYGRYVQFVDDVFVSHADGSQTMIYATGDPPARALLGTNGYTTKPGLVAVPSERVAEGADTEALVAGVAKLAEQQAQVAGVRSELELAKKFLALKPDRHLESHIREAEAALLKVETQEATPEQIQSAMHTARRALGHTHPLMESYTGHLVGHAHIDLQWLWEWQEGIVFTKDTFAQAVKFMDEFPGFTFSQSSSCLYQAMEEHYSDLFKLIRAKVKRGQWELVGGRICEADTNLISHESHVRQFLYGQRYFRERFGKIATVGWEPDTFGHAIQMPQILKLSGCDSYYFCRAGKGKPLFWWEGLDGTRILTFEEPATGSWYNSDLSYKQFEEIADFKKAVGSDDMLWVYGVGNHGGGPTREYILEALKWMKEPGKAKVRFSTATEFFRKLRTYDLSKIPVIAEELNPVFDGCYTSHAEIKRANRDAEAWTTTAEAVAAAATHFGFSYPRANFRRNWEEIAFNHHHDTLPGSGIHAPYARTLMQYARVIADDRDIVTRALESIVINTTPEPGGISVLVFNPLGWKRSGWVELHLVQSGWDGGEKLDPERAFARATGSREQYVRLMDRASRLGRFYATDIPAFGYKVFQIRTPQRAIAGADVEDGKWKPFEGNAVAIQGGSVSFDPRSGAIRHLSIPGRRFETKLGLGRLEVHYENPQGMSAWTIGKIERVEPLRLAGGEYRLFAGQLQFRFRHVLEARNDREGDSHFVQTFSVDPESGLILCEVEGEWNAIGGGGQPSPMVRVAFDTGLPQAKATYEVPFGALARPQDGIEYPALKWADLADGSKGIAVLNDAMHGFSAQDGVLRMSLIRSSFDPDPVPNPGRHRWRYGIVPHAGDWRAARIPQLAAEFNQPMVWATVPYEAKGPNPRVWSPLTIEAPNVLATSLKLAEDDDSLILRYFEGQGAKTPNPIRLNVPIRSATLVNFLEDRLGPARLTQDVLESPLRPWEIQTVKLQRGRR
jgi:alpha-mannosidase